MNIFSKNKFYSLLYYPLKFKNLLNLEKKIIFYHIPRSRGTFIKNILKKYYGKTFELNNFKEITSDVLKKNKIIVGHFEFTNLSNFNISTFTAIRKPNELYNSYYRLYCKENIKLPKDDFIKLVKNNNADNILTRIFSKKVGSSDFFFYKRKEIKKKYLELNFEDCKLAYDNIKKISYFKSEELNNILKYINVEYNPGINELYKGFITNSENQQDLDFSEIANLDHEIYSKLF